MSATPAEEPTKVYITPSEVREILRELGVPLDLLIHAAQQGFVERLNSTPPYDPVTKAGYDAWAYVVRALRAGLDDLGFRMDDPRSLPLAVSDKHKINITVSSGDIGAQIGATRGSDFISVYAC